MLSAPAPARRRRRRTCARLLRSRCARCCSSARPALDALPGLLPLAVDAAAPQLGAVGQLLRVDPAAPGECRDAAADDVFRGAQRLLGVLARSSRAGPSRAGCLALRVFLRAIVCLLTCAGAARPPYGGAAGLGRRFRLHVRLDAAAQRADRALRGFLAARRAGRAAATRRRTGRRSPGDARAGRARGAGRRRRRGSAARARAGPRRAARPRCGRGRPLPRVRATQRRAPSARRRSGSAASAPGGEGGSRPGGCRRAAPAPASGW